MNISNLRATSSLKPLTRPSLYWTFADALVLAKRHLIQIPRIPEELIFATIQPIMFVLLFRYVFGGAIAVSGTSYVNYLMAGIFAQTVIFGSTNTGIGLATDLQKGLVTAFARCRWQDRPSSLVAPSLTWYGVPSSCLSCGWSGCWSASNHRAMSSPGWRRRGFCC